MARRRGVPLDPVPRVWFASELYYPDQNPTGHYLTKLAEGLAQTAAVSVLCVQPTYSARGTTAPKHEVRNGVVIWRCAGTTFDRNRFALRLINVVTISVSIFFAALKRLRRHDIVIVVTVPPTLPYLVRLACAVRGATCILRVEDVYPDLLVAAGWATSRAPIVRAWSVVQRLLYRSMARVIVLGRDMQERVERTAGGQARIELITNFADTEEIQPRSRSSNDLLSRLGIGDRFVLQYSGNMGRVHALGSLLDAAELLRPRTEIHFLLIGDGAKRRWLEEQVAERALPNVTLLPYQPRERLADSLAACDVAVIPLLRGASGVSVPSRTYNVLSSGRAILAVAEPDAEVARVVTEERIGWVAPPDDPEKISDAILEALADPDAIREMGRRARGVAESKYSERAVIGAYRSLLRDVVEGRADN